MAKVRRFQDDDLITTAEAGQELGVSPNRIIQFIKKNRLPIAKRVGTNYLIRYGDLEKVRVRKTGRPKRS